MVFPRQRPDTPTATAAWKPRRESYPDQTKDQTSKPTTDELKTCRKRNRQRVQIQPKRKIVSRYWNITIIEQQLVQKNDQRDYHNRHALLRLEDLVVLVNKLEPPTATCSVTRTRLL